MEILKPSAGRGIVARALGLWGPTPVTALCDHASAASNFPRGKFLGRQTHPRQKNPIAAIKSLTSPLPGCDTIAAIEVPMARQCGRGFLRPRIPVRLCPSSALRTQKFLVLLAF